MKFTTFTALIIMLASSAALASRDAWDLCDKTTIQQVASALRRSDLVTLSRPEMIHGTCTSNGHLRDGERIGVQIIFGTSGAADGIGTSVYTPLPNADPMTNPTSPEFAVGRHQ